MCSKWKATFYDVQNLLWAFPRTGIIQMVGCFCYSSSPFTMVCYGSLYDHTIYLVLYVLTTLCVPVTTSFQPPLGEQCLVHTVHKSWEKSGCEARKLVTLNWMACIVVSLIPRPSLPPVLITCSVQKRREKVHHMIRNSRSSSSITAYCVWSQTGSTRNKATWGCVGRKYCGTVITQQC